MRAAVLGLGEAGTLYSAGLVAQGWTVAGYDPADNATPAGVVRAATAEEAVRGADAVLSLVGGKAAAAAARRGRPVPRGRRGLRGHERRRPGGEASDRRRRRARTGSPTCRWSARCPRYGAATSVVISGAGSGRAAQVFGALGAPVEDIAGEPG